jgi:chemotaxis response regulator CheB
VKLTSVIVVDDDNTLVKVFEQYLKLNNINVLGQCYDGKEAVTLYEKLKPDVVLLDIMMPHYDEGFRNNLQTLRYERYFEYNRICS